MIIDCSERNHQKRKVQLSYRSSFVRVTYKHHCHEHQKRINGVQHNLRKWWRRGSKCNVCVRGGGGGLNYVMIEIIYILSVYNCAQGMRLSIGGGKMQRHSVYENGRSTLKTKARPAYAVRDFVCVSCLLLLFLRGVSRGGGGGGGQRAGSTGSSTAKTAISRCGSGSGRVRKHPQGLELRSTVYIT